jgi:twitching motility protein PilJ
MQGQYELAESATNQLVQTYPDDANLRLLKGHILFGSQEYLAAQEEYEAVLDLTDDPELRECAQSSLADIQNYLGTLRQRGSAESNFSASAAEIEREPTTTPFLSPDFAGPDSVEPAKRNLETAMELTPSDPLLVNPFDSQPLAATPSQEPTPSAQSASSVLEDPSAADAFPNPRASSATDMNTEHRPMDNHPESDSPNSTAAATAMPESNLSFLDEEGTQDLRTMDHSPSDSYDLKTLQIDELDSFEFRPLDVSDEDDSPVTASFSPTMEAPSLDLDVDAGPATTFQTDEDFAFPSAENGMPHDFSAYVDGQAGLEEAKEDAYLVEQSFEPMAQSFTKFEQPAFNELDDEPFYDPMLLEEEDQTAELNWSDAIPQVDMPEGDAQDEALELLNTEFLRQLENPVVDEDEPSNNTSFDRPTPEQKSVQKNYPVEVIPKDGAIASAPRRQGVMAPYLNASIQRKQWMMAGATGVVAAVAVLVSGQVGGQKNLAQVGGMAASAGLFGGLTTLLLGQVVAKQLRNSTSDLQTKFAAVAQGDWTVQATELSEDEFGQLARSFNTMTRAIEANTQEVQQKAEEQEKAKEDLQRQVIRLLDDVEGAARGDLTVQAEVTADILGAVADSFNLTIYNLQKIVKQVKVAAREVSFGAAENEQFARGLSSDALRQAEELAATLNSVQMMTSSIQEVAESARAADNVAQRASETALKGGEAVERTVTGILQIRETVAETTRKVKRLAESSQEISKIVSLISQIASRTNLLALNASIEAARAGESGRGFAVVADEVRQLADRASKASKEIEQIVLQIQGETSSVMTAMEEGTQQVIEGTQRAEQAKRSLDDIIQVSSQINQLVGSITQATAEQTETSRYVAQVMQSVELTAQETSQESQRVSDSLRNLVGVARDLQNSVERFKVDGTEVS